MEIEDNMDNSNNDVKGKSPAEDVTITDDNVDDDVDDEIIRLMNTSLSGAKIESKYVDRGEPGEKGDSGSCTGGSLTGDIPMSEIGGLGTALRTMTNDPMAAMELVKSGLNSIPGASLDTIKEKARKGGGPAPMVNKLLKGKHKEKLPDRKNLKIMDTEMKKHMYTMAKEKETVGLADGTLLKAVTFCLSGRLKERMMQRNNYFGELNKGGTPMRITTIKVGLCSYNAVDAPKMKPNKRANKLFNFPGYKLGGEVVIVPHIGSTNIEEVESWEENRSTLTISLTTPENLGVSAS